LRDGHTRHLDLNQRPDDGGVFAYELANRPGDSYQDQGRRDGVVRERLHRVGDGRQRPVVLEAVQLIQHDQGWWVEGRQSSPHNLRGEGIDFGLIELDTEIGENVLPERSKGVVRDAVHDDGLDV